MLERPAPNGPGHGGFVVYLEGPRDRDIVCAWARSLLPRLARAVASSTVILGGRQPARALSHFRRTSAEGKVERGLCLLDRDALEDPKALESEKGLEFFTWGRRHIESYLLVPDAIRRGLRISRDGVRACSLRDVLPDPLDEGALMNFDAKRLLAPNGELARAIGSIAPGRIARRMRPDEFHSHVNDLLSKLSEGFGLASSPVTQIRRWPPPV